MFNQLEFLDNEEEKKLREQITILHQKYESLRKSYYANDNKRKKEIYDIQHKLETFIIAVCKNQEYKDCFIR